MLRLILGYPVKYKRAVVVNVDFQLARIWNHCGTKSLGMSVRWYLG